MFKLYEFSFAIDGDIQTVMFYVHRKARRNGGFFHRAIAVGTIPRLDNITSDYAKYQRNTERLEKAMRANTKFVPGGQLVLECWQGKHVLCKLWEQLAALPFTDMQGIYSHNPFDTDEEPDHYDLVEPDDVFG